MKILVVNDDGIYSEGIIALAKMALELGEVWVIAPDSECSAMSQHITVRGPIHIEEHDFPLPVKKAYAVSGTPADCVKVGVAYLLKEKPDYVFSGINNGYNAGGDVLYSGTVGAAMEGLVQGIQGIAFSNAMNAPYGAVREHLASVTNELLRMEKLTNEIWNVNFPGTEEGMCRGVLWDRKIAPFQYYLNNYEINHGPDRITMVAGGDVYSQPMELTETDMSALKHGYVSVGKVRCMAL